ncbi:MAG: DUF6526 family protein [Chitinophagaceae bacterium]
MKEQNYKNHIRLLFLWHGLVFFAILALIVGSIINLKNSASENKYSASLLVVVSIVLAFIWAFARLFALKAQDRAIRAEENFRFFILTGKPLDKQLRLGQIIALRFASDDELPALAKKAVDEKLSPKQIKESIQSWKGDYHRV